MSMENLSLSDIAAATGNDGFGNSGGFWIFALLLLFMYGGGNWGNNAGQAATSGDLQRAIDLNSIQEGQAGISADIQRGIYEINGATKDAAYNNLSEIRDVQAAIASGFANQQTCCCETKQAIMENRYLDAQNASNIMANNTENTQKILDAISQNRIAAMQDQINALQLQNAMAGVVRYPSATTYGAGCSCFANTCNCGNV